MPCAVRRVLPLCAPALVALALGACGDDSIAPPTVAPTTTEAGAHEAGKSAADGGATTPDGPHLTPDGSGFDAVDFGLGDCGTTATKTLRFTNTGPKALVGTYVASAPFNVTPATATIPPGGVGSFTVSVAVPRASTAGAELSGTLTLQTNDPEHAALTIPVRITANGATLAFADATTKIDFGTTSLGGKADRTIDVKNTGNKAASFVFAPPVNPAFALTTTPASPITLEPGATTTLTASFTPASTDLRQTFAAIEATSAICGASLDAIPLSGQGTKSLLTGWPTTTIDFGSGACGGARAATQSFTLTSASSVDVTLTAVPFGSKGYTANVAAGTKIPAKGSLVVTLTPPLVPTPSAIPGSYGDTVTFTTDGVGDAPHVVNLALAAQGAILQLDTSATPGFGTFATTAPDATTSQSFALKNVGNLATQVTLKTAAPFGVSATTASVAPGAPAALKATFTPPDAKAYNGTLSFTAAGLCQPAPAAVTLKGQGDACPGADLMTDPNNCGACGVNCTSNGESCRKGECLIALDIEQSTSDVFWRVAGWYAPSTQAGVYTASKSKLDTSKLLSASNDVRALIASNGYVAWGSADGIHAGPVGGTPSLLVAKQHAEVDYDVEDIAMDATKIYWVEGTLYGAAGDVYSMPLGGGTVTTLAATSIATPLGIAVDANYVYWSTYDYFHDVVTIYRIPRGGGSVATLATYNQANNLPYRFTYDAQYGTSLNISRHPLRVVSGVIYAWGNLGIYRYTNATGVQLVPNTSATDYFVDSGGLYVLFNGIFKVASNGVQTLVHDAFGVDEWFTMDASKIYINFNAFTADASPRN